MNSHSKTDTDGGDRLGEAKMQWRKAFLGLGGNVGDVLANMRSALKILAESGVIKIIRSSSIYETPPWGLENQPVFLNACVEISTCAKPQRLLELCLSAERSLKRIRNVRWGPRTIDIDILLLEEGSFDSNTLVVPHPRIPQRAFVLVPLTEIAGSRMLDGKTIAEWREQCDESGIRKIAGSDVFDDLLWSSLP